MKFNFMGQSLQVWPHPLHLKHWIGLCPSLTGPPEMATGPFKISLGSNTIASLLFLQLSSYLAPLIFNSSQQT